MNPDVEANPIKATPGADAPAALVVPPRAPAAGPDTPRSRPAATPPRPGEFQATEGLTRRPPSLEGLTNAKRSRTPPRELPQRPVPQRPVPARPAARP